MKQSTRYGIIGLSALALLSSVSWIRGLHLNLEPTGKYLLGVAPNFSAAIAIVYVLLGIWADQKPDSTFHLTRRWFLICASISCLGLVGWEFIQKLSKRLVFDIDDIIATIVGIGVATLIFYLITPRGERAKISWPLTGSF